MKILKSFLLVITVGAFLVFSQQSCQSDTVEEVSYTKPSAAHEYHSLLEQIHAESIDTIRYNMENPFLAEGNSTTDVLLDLHGKPPFQVETVQGKLTYFPCSNCHTEPLEKLQVGLNKKEKNAHWEISLQHADPTTMDCQTCHSPHLPDSLQTLNRQVVTMDHSYQLCAQCHSTQAKDWVGGAHGKRLGGWVEPRVAKTCVSCHNPHKPAIGSRWPARLNTYKLNQQSSY